MVERPENEVKPKRETLENRETYDMHLYSESPLNYVWQKKHR